MKTNRSSRTGGVLVIVMVIVVTLSLMVAALLNLGKFNAFETERQLKLTRARWIAEAGYEKVAAIIRANAQSLGNVPDNLTGDFENDAGHYEVAIKKTLNYLGKPDVTQFIITSTGKVNDALSGVVEAAVKAVLIGAPGIDYSIAALSGISTISPSEKGVIDGDIYVNGTLRAKGVTANADGGPGKIQGTVELGGSDSVSDTEGAREVVEDLNLPPLDRTPYTNLLNYAANTNNIGVIAGGTIDGLALGGGTNYYNTSVINNGDITGHGTIVVNGTVTFPNASTVAADVKIVASNNVSFGNHITLKERTEIFTMKNISFATQGATATNGTVLLAMGDIDPIKNMNFNGIIYAEGQVNITSGSNIRGTVIAGTGFNVAANVNITYDPSVFANPNPLPFLTWVLTERRQWQESPF